MSKPLIWTVWLAALVLASAAVADDAIRKREQPQPRQPGQALSTTTVGSAPSAPTVTPPASFSLTLDGDIDLGGFVFQGGTPFIHNEGGAQWGNTAVGLNALASVDTSISFIGHYNSALGKAALQNNTDGFYNSATGFGALYKNITGAENTAIGTRAAYSNTSGWQNVAIGYRALYYNGTGRSNTAIGSQPITNNTTGSYNTAVGDSAGNAWTTGDNNIAVGAGAWGLAAEAGTIRIGGQDKQTTTFIEGINNASVAGSPVCITAGDELGLCQEQMAAQELGLSPVLLGEIRRLEAELATLRRRLDELERGQ